MSCNVCLFKAETNLTISKSISRSLILTEPSSLGFPGKFETYEAANPGRHVRLWVFVRNVVQFGGLPVEEGLKTGDMGDAAGVGDAYGSGS